MREKIPTVVALGGGLLIATGFLAWLLIGERSGASLNPFGRPAPETVSADGKSESTKLAVPVDDATIALQQSTAVDQLKGLLERRLAKKDARVGEAVLTFSSEDAYRKFLARARQSGLKLRGQLDALRTVRVGYDSLDSLANEMIGNPSDYQGVDANYLVHVPETPVAEDRPRVSQVSVGNNSLGLLGVTGDHSQWGRGITVAVLDTGVALDATFGSGRVQALDVGFGVAPGSGQEDGHGTAVAGLVGGASADAPGVAPAANILSIRVTDADGTSDSFTLAQGILAAVDAGARIINISMGSYSATNVLSNAIDYASAQGAVIVASAGNDGAAQLTWPAADPRVVSVGAVDALEQQVYFSNAGPQLKITAPGYGVDAAWLNGQRVSFDGTSASAPFVAGAIAAIMSTTPGLNATQASAVLQQYASDGGTPGLDADYGSGILNLGWAMNRNDTTRIDTAVAGQYYDAKSGTMDVVVQNRGGQTIGGLLLSVNISGIPTTQSIPPLNPGATYLDQVPVNSAQAAAAAVMIVRTRLNNPSGVVDQVPGNNAKAGVILPPASGP